MKQFVIFLSFLFSVGTALGQAAGNYSAYNTLENQFTKKKLEQNEIELFSQRAMQKLTDATGYLELASTSRFDEGLRLEAGEMATELFLDEGQTFWSVSRGCKSHVYPMIGEYAKRTAKSTLQGSLKFKYENLDIHEQATATEDGRYRGILHVEMRSEWEEFGKTTCAYDWEGKLYFWLIREKKDFGGKEKLVWAVKLGSVVEKEE